MKNTFLALAYMSSCILLVTTYAVKQDAGCVVTMLKVPLPNTSARKPMKRHSDMDGVSIMMAEPESATSPGILDVQTGPIAKHYIGGNAKVLFVTSSAFSVKKKRWQDSFICY